MTDSNSTPTKPARRHRGALLAGLIALTLSAGVAAKMTHGSNPVPPPTTSAGGPVQASAQLDRTSVLEGSDGLVRVELALRGDEIFFAGQPTIPTDLVVVLDRSGSMRGRPLQFAKAAVRELLGQLGERDRFGLVTYSSGGSVTIPLEGSTPAARRRWERAIDAVSANGGTNMAHGLDLAHQLLGDGAPGRAPRVVLLSDGHANQGDHSLAGLQRRAARAVSSEYVISSVGVGHGFDESVMSAVADAGTGNFYYLSNLQALAGVFSDEFASARETVASSLVVSMTPAQGVRLESAAGYPLERTKGATFFHPGNLFAGQERRIWLTLRVPTASTGDFGLPPIQISYVDGKGAKHRISLDELPRVACVAGEDDYYASFEAGVYKRGFVAESVGALKEKVAAQLKNGRREDAVAELEEYRRNTELEQMRALGYIDGDALASVTELQDTVNAPAAAEPEVQNQLGKQLLEAGRDQRRSGSKR
jgi:Ca-activated chloride channel family protein